jgi:hypothetical protein
MKRLRYSTAVFVLLILFHGCGSHAIVKHQEPEPVIAVKKDTLVVITQPVDTIKPKIDTVKAVPQRTLEGNIQKLFTQMHFSFQLPKGVVVEKVRTDTAAGLVSVYCNELLSWMPFRESTVHEIYDSLKPYFAKENKISRVKMYSLNRPIEDLIPNFYRASKSAYDITRIPPEPGTQVVHGLSKPYVVSAGLQNRSLVVWPSHGRYYTSKSSRWEWQRPRLFQTVEDLLSYSIVIPYLVPMLENAGANVYVPRERDIQTSEVIVDNDSPTDISSGAYEEKLTGYSTIKNGSGNGYAKTDSYSGRENPFQRGTFRALLSDTITSTKIQWTPDIPRQGEYAVYITYKASTANSNAVHYTVNHAGGSSEFVINQQIGGDTWYYLGTFEFNKGRAAVNGSVSLDNKGPNAGLWITADAVRFGGGMGQIVRDGSTSGLPKFCEAARYWLQTAGMPDSLVYFLNDKNEYKDDYQARPEYVNYLCGMPKGPSGNRNAGLHVPIDMSLALHTDAGIARHDSVVGTMSIYSIKDFSGSDYYPGGISRFAARDAADIIQTQIVSDIQAAYNKNWVRRSLRNADYSEATRPNVPAVLLELFSHQNFSDMLYAHDPKFKMSLARSIYKGIVKYFSVYSNTPYVIQPLPVSHLASRLTDNSSVTISWTAEKDSLEPTAVPTAFVVYRREGSGGFDNGTATSGTEITFNDLKPGNVYSFKVTAVNAGGESFPSEIIAAGISSGSKKPVLIVNGFHRLAAPASISTPDFEGFLNFSDAGVPYKYSVDFTGAQNDFNPASEFKSNDAPGHGASYADFEGRVIAGNTFDYPAVHGEAIIAAGYSFATCGDDAVIDKAVELNNYVAVDVIYGEEKSLSGGQSRGVIPRELAVKLKKYLAKRGNLFITGAYISTDIFKTPNRSDVTTFTNENLHFDFAGSHASMSGEVWSCAPDIFPDNFILRFNTTENDSMYKVEAPDGLQPMQKAKTILRYAENRTSAAVAYKNDYGVVAFGFPFETILDKQQRLDCMRYVLKYLTEK